MDIRSFLAFEQPPEIRETLVRVSAELRKGGLDVRWVKPENIHLTVHFLGNVRDEDLETLEGPLQKLCLTYGPFPISLKGMGCFPNNRNPRVIWIGLEGDLERMSRFRDALQAALKPLEFRVEDRAFRPHLTLGRFRGGARGGELDRTLDRYRELASPASVLRELILFRSDLRPTGSVYTRLRAWPLTGKE